MTLPLPAVYSQPSPSTPRSPSAKATIDQLANRHERTVAEHHWGVRRHALSASRAARDDDVQPHLDAGRGNSAISSVSEPKRIKSSTVNGSLEKRRMVRVGPTRARGGIIALTRDPSGRRASTMGELSSMRRPKGATIFSMMCCTCWLSRKRTSVQLEAAPPLDVDLKGAVHHDLADGRVVHQRVDGAVPRHLVDDLLLEPFLLLPGEVVLAVGDHCGDDACDLLFELPLILLGLGQEIGADLVDQSVVNRLFESAIEGRPGPGVASVAGAPAMKTSPVSRPA